MMLSDLNIFKHDISSSVQNRLSSLCSVFFFFSDFVAFKTLFYLKMFTLSDVRMALNPWVRVRWFGDEDCKRSWACRRVVRLRG